MPQLEKTLAVKSETGVKSPNPLGGHRDRGAELSPSPAGVHGGDTSTHAKK